MLFFKMNTYICVFFLLLGHKANHFHLDFPNFSFFCFLIFEKRGTNSKRGGLVAPNVPPPHPTGLMPITYIHTNKTE